MIRVRISNRQLVVDIHDLNLVDRRIRFDLDPLQIEHVYSAKFTYEGITFNIETVISKDSYQEASQEELENADWRMI